MPAVLVTGPTATQSLPFLPRRWPKPSPIAVGCARRAAHAGPSLGGRGANEFYVGKKGDRPFCNPCTRSRSNLAMPLVQMQAKVEVKSFPALVAQIPQHWIQTPAEAAGPWTMGPGCCMVCLFATQLMLLSNLLLGDSGTGVDASNLPGSHSTVRQYEKLTDFLQRCKCASSNWCAFVFFFGARKSNCLVTVSVVFRFKS